MARFIGKRLLMLIPIMIGLSFLTYLLMYISPGDPVRNRLNAQGIVAEEQVIEQVRQEMGLDKPFLERYVLWCKGVLQGDLGTSYHDDEPVASLLKRSVKYTAILTFFSLLVTLVFSVPLGIVSAVRKDGVIDSVVRVLSFTANSLPNFLIAVLLMYLLCIKFKLLPVIAQGTFKGMLLPVLALSLPLIGRFTRQIRAEVLEQLSKDYVTGAYARGLKEHFVLYSNVLHNSLLTILTITGLSIGGLLGGSVVVETIFRWPGVGKMVMDAILQTDYPVIQGFVLLMAAIYVVVNLLIDIGYRLVDPRIESS